MPTMYLPNSFLQMIYANNKKKYLPWKTRSRTETPVDLDILSGFAGTLYKKFYTVVHSTRLSASNGRHSVGIRWVVRDVMYQLVYNVSLRCTYKVLGKSWRIGAVSFSMVRKSDKISSCVIWKV